MHKEISHENALGIVTHSILLYDLGVNCKNLSLFLTVINFIRIESSSTFDEDVDLENVK